MALLRFLTLLLPPALPLLAGTLSTAVDLHINHDGISEANACAGASFANCAIVTTIDGSGTTLSGTASATIGHASATTYIALPFVGLPGNDGSATADASFSDTLTVTGGTGAGWIQWFFRGSNESGNVCCSPNTQFRVQNLTFPGFEGPFHGTFDGASQLYPFVFSTPFPFDVRVHGESWFNAYDGILVGRIDAKLYKIAVFDADLQPLSSFRVVGENGNLYLPEPSTLLPVGLGTLLLLWHRRHPRHTRKEVSAKVACT